MPLKRAFIYFFLTKNLVLWFPKCRNYNFIINCRKNNISILCSKFGIYHYDRLEMSNESAWPIYFKSFNASYHAIVGPFNKLTMPSCVHKIFITSSLAHDSFITCHTLNVSCALIVPDNKNFR